MATEEKDVTEKRLEDFNDVFADIINALIFNGEQVVSEDELAPLPTQLQPTGDQRERNVLKLWKNRCCFQLTLLGAEGQAEADDDDDADILPMWMFIRSSEIYGAQALQHDAAREGRDLLSLPSFPVITLVLNFGKEPWGGPTTLFECFGVDSISEEIKPFLNDYELNVIDIPYLTPEQVELFRSDFRFVADYFVQSRLKEGDYTPSRKGLTHVNETLKLMATLTKDARFVDVVRNKV